MGVCPADRALPDGRLPPPIGCPPDGRLPLPIKRLYHPFHAHTRPCPCKRKKATP